MAIEFSKYVKITSSVGGGSAASRRDFGLRVFTTSPSLAYGKVLVCNTEDEVGNVFGFGSKEYSIAVNYFGYVSNSITKAKQISFARWMSGASGAMATTVSAANAPGVVADMSGEIGVAFRYGQSDAEIVIQVDDPYGDYTHADVANLFTAALLSKSQESGYGWLAASACSFDGGSYNFMFMSTKSRNEFNATDWAEFDSEEVEDWAASTAYSVGDFVKSGAVFYCCKAAHTSGSSFVATNWSEKPSSVSAWSDVSGYAIGSWVTKGGTTYCSKIVIEDPTKGPNVSLIPLTDATATDARNVMGLRNYNAFVPADWVSPNDSEITTWVAGHTYEVGDFVTNADLTYCCKEAHTPGHSFDGGYWSQRPSTISSWGDDSAYAVGAWVMKDGIPYCCVKAISAPTGTNPVIDRNVTVSAETPAEAFARVNSNEDNFGSFMFVESLTENEKKSVAQKNKAYNYKYLNLTYALPGSYSQTASALNGFDCTAVTYENRQSEFAEFMPAALFASTDYTRVNSTKTFMYKQFSGINPSVGLKTDVTPTGKYSRLYEDLDSKRINYYGETMKSGRPLCFYQDGVCMDGNEISVACNEIWFKDAIQTEIINLFVAMEKVPANTDGIVMIGMMVDGVCGEALNNGTFIKEKALTNTQKAYVDTLAGEKDAWKSVVSNGYWKNIVIRQEVTEGGTKYVADYVIIYSKGDSIRKVNGSNVMI